LDKLDPAALPPEVQQMLAELGPFLANGWTFTEIGQRIGRSDDWVSQKVAEVRQAIAEQTRIGN